jgi:hypothetical protein
MLRTSLRTLAFLPGQRKSIELLLTHRKHLKPLCAWCGYLDIVKQQFKNISKVIRSARI